MSAAWAIRCFTTKRILWVSQARFLFMDLSVQSTQRISGYRPILERLLDDAAFLWQMRSQAVAQPHYFREDIAAQDQRIQRHLYALRQAPDDAWALVTSSLESADADYSFVAAMLAFSAQESKKIQRVIKTVMDNDRALPGLVSALAWLPGPRIYPWIKKFLISKDLNHKFLGIAACSVRRDNPKNYLTAIFQRPDCQAHDQLFVRALRLAGELKRTDLLPMLREAQNDDREPVRFWASWSAVLLGDTSAPSILRSIALQSGEFQDSALELLLRMVEVNEGRRLVDELSHLPDTTRQMIRACAILGDVDAIPWLIQTMHQPESNRLAAEAFVTITGVDLERQQLLSGGGIASPEDAPEELFADDTHLPYVDAHKVVEFWQTHNTRWQAGQRYFLGRNIEPQHVRDIFRDGNQRQRRMAALCWALLEPTQVMPNHAAMEVVA
jgi:uncharacterized protein (TIGR02270 family)